MAHSSEQQLVLVKDMVAQVEDICNSVDRIGVHINDLQEIASSTDKVATSGRQDLNLYNENVFVAGYAWYD